MATIIWILCTWGLVMAGMTIVYAGVWAAIETHSKVDWTITAFVAVVITILIGVWKCLL